MKIIIVGAGAFGAWAAYHARLRGAEVALVDSWGAGNTRASSGGESRVIRAIYGPDELYTRLTAESLQQWRAFDQRWGHACFLPCGALWLLGEGGEAGYIEEALPHMAVHDLPVERMEMKELRRRYPAIGTQGLRAAYLEREAGMLHAREACRRVVEAFVQLGGNYRLAHALPEIPEKDGESPRLLFANGERWHADAIVFACGPWLPKLFPELSAHRLSVTRQEVYFFALPAGDTQHRHPALPVWLELGEELYYGLPGDGLRGFKVADDWRETPFDPDSEDRDASPGRLAKARAYLARRFPGLAGASLQETRVCQYLNTPDGHFIIDRHPRAEQMWIAGAGCGHAFKMGPAIGRYIAECLLEQRSPEERFQLRRLPRPIGEAKFQIGR